MCPTCFCTTVQDHADLRDNSLDRVRHWDTCFSPGFLYTPRRQRPAFQYARYRQWLTHKLSTWHAQFGQRVRGVWPVHHVVPGWGSIWQVRAVAVLAAAHARTVPRPAHRTPAHVQASNERGAMSTMKTLEPILSDTVFKGMKPDTWP